MSSIIMQLLLPQLSVCCTQSSLPYIAGEADDAPINATAGSKPILTNLQTGPGVDFGAVKIDAVEDPARLRQKLAAASQRPIPAS